MSSLWVIRIESLMSGVEWCREMTNQMWLHYSAHVNLKYSYLVKFTGKLRLINLIFIDRNTPQNILLWNKNL